MAFTFRLGVSTVRKIVYETCTAIHQKLLPVVRPTPTESKWKEIEQRFRLKWNFPHCMRIYLSTVTLAKHLTTGN